MPARRPAARHASAHALRRRDGIAASSPLVAAAAAIAASLGMAAAGSDLPPCPEFLELPCFSSGDDSPGTPQGPVPQCAPGAGQWVTTQEHQGTPASPMDRVDEYSVGWTRWCRSVNARSEPNRIVIGTSLYGQSIFFGAASQTAGAGGGFSTVDRETWQGPPPAAPRLLQLSAEGFASMGLSVVCAPRIGCSAAGSVSVSGTCSSLGDAWAMLPSRTLDAMAIYDSIVRRIRVAGQIGGRVDDSGLTYIGEISASDSMYTEGTGLAAGSASYTVKPDRTYCAFTNRPVVRRALGNAVAAANVSVEAGHAAASAIAMVHMGVN